MRACAQVATFAYHEVTDDSTTSGFQRPGARPYTLTRLAFATHLNEIARTRLLPGVLPDLDLAQPGKHIILTFDDGGKSALYASEMLCRRGWRGHFFIVTNRIGTTRFLTATDIRHIRSCGHLIGTHSHTHPEIFCDLSASRMREEWRISAAILADLLAEPCAAGAVPGGDISRAVLPSAAAAGLRYLFTSEPCLAPRAVDGCWILGRVFPKRTMSPARVRQLAEFRGWTGALMARELKVLARWSMPRLYRLYVRLRTTEPGGPGARPAEERG